MTKVSLVDLTLNEWSVGNGSIHIPATIPGEIHMHLLNAGIINDPYYRDNYVKYRWIAKDEWTYECTFAVDEHGQNSSFYLLADGLDTVATIKVNGNIIGNVDNQFRQHIIAVPFHSIHPSADNLLQITFHSAIRYAEEKAREYPYVVPDGFAPEQHGERNRNFIRKEQCSFSWDWGPCFATCGIYKPIRLLALVNAVHIVECSPVVYDQDDHYFLVKVHTKLLANGVQKSTLSISVGQKNASLDVE